MPRASGPSLGVVFRLAYGHNDATYLAHDIAGVAASGGVPVRFYSTKRARCLVDSKWDGKVANVPYPARLDKRYMKGKTDIVWLECCNDEVNLAYRSGLRNHFVLSPTTVNQLTREDPLSTSVITLGDPLKHPTAQLIPAGTQSLCSGLNLQQGNKNPSMDSLWLTDGKMVTGGLAYILGPLLEHFTLRNLKITLLCDGSWDSGAGRVLMDLRKRFGDRIQVHKDIGRQERKIHYANSGSVVLASCDDWTGGRMLESMCSGVPMAGFVYGPRQGLAKEFPEVWQLPCQESGFGCDVTDSSKLLSSLNWFYSAVSTGDMPGCNGGQLAEFLSVRRRGFLESWSRVFCLG